MPQPRQTAQARRTAPADRRTAASRPRLDSRFAVLQRGDGTLQIGISPERAVVVRPPHAVPPGTLAVLLRMLDGSTRLDRALRRTRIPFDDVAGVLDELTRAGLLGLGPEPRVPRRVVTVHGDGPLSDRLREALPSIGADVRCSGTPAAGDRLAESLSSELVVLADQIVVEPRVQRLLHEAATPHLHVHLRDGAGALGPLVLPGRTACMGCGDLHRRDADPAWPELMLRLLGRSGHADPPTVAATVGLASARVRAFLLSRRAAAHGRATAPPRLDTLVEVDAAEARIRTAPWPAHPECGCRAAAFGAAAPAPKRSAAPVPGPSGADREQWCRV